MHGYPRILARELLWWLRGLTTLLRIHPGAALVSVALLWWFADEVPVAVWVLLALITTVLRSWALNRPTSFTRWLYGPVRGHAWALAVRRRWDEICEACDLPGAELVSLRVRWPRIVAVAQPALGQALEDYERAGEPLRHAVAASHLRVQPESINRVGLTFTLGDGLAQPFDAAPPPATVALAGGVELGRLENGRPWRLPVGPHTLVAGCSGSGKGSVFWSFAFGLAPAVRQGHVQLHGIDLKGGMEILMGEPLFTTTATSPEAAVATLERLVELMQGRTKTYAGHVRAHSPTTEEPLHVVMIDELAALTAYCSDRDLQRRAELAINLLCSQGRAPGFLVFACLQDPRKEVIPSRGLFTQMVGLRLKDASETSMVLGDLAVASGAHCHRITRDTPGIGYVVPEDGGHPVRVRAGYASDEAIRSVATRYATPVRLSISDAEPRPRRPRPGGVTP